MKTHPSKIHSQQCDQRLHVLIQIYKLGLHVLMIGLIQACNSADGLTLRAKETQASPKPSSSLIQQISHSRIDHEEEKITGLLLGGMRTSNREQKQSIFSDAKADRDEHDDFEAQEIPTEYLCSITQDIMLDPVLAADGHTYEREEIEKWLAKNGTSPMTRQTLKIEELRPNRALQDAIKTFRKSLPAIQQQRKSREEKDLMIKLREEYIRELLKKIDNPISPDEKNMDSKGITKLEQLYKAWKHDAVELEEWSRNGPLVGEVESLLRYREVATFQKEHHLKLAVLLQGVGTYYHIFMKDFDRAFKNYKEAYRIQRMFYGAELHPSLLKTFKQIGALHENNPQLSEALDTLDTSFQTYQKIYEGKQKLEIATMLSVVGNSRICHLINLRNKEPKSSPLALLSLSPSSHSTSEALRAAFSMLEKSLELCKRIHGVTQDVVADSLYAIGKNHIRLSAYDTAITYLEQAETMYKNSLGSHHAKTRAAGQSKAMASREKMQAQSCRLL